MLTIHYKKFLWLVTILAYSTHITAGDNNRRPGVFPRVVNIFSNFRLPFGNPENPGFNAHDEHNPAVPLKERIRLARERGQVERAYNDALEPAWPRFSTLLGAGALLVIRYPELIQASADLLKKFVQKTYQWFYHKPDNNNEAQNPLGVSNENYALLRQKFEEIQKENAQEQQAERRARFLSNNEKLAVILLTKQNIVNKYPDKTPDEQANKQKLQQQLDRELFAAFGLTTKRKEQDKLAAPKPSVSTAPATEAQAAKA